ncbi:MAG: metallophosphoesterase [Kofleriaceae bacterium]
MRGAVIFFAFLASAGCDRAKTTKVQKKNPAGSSAGPNAAAAPVPNACNLTALPLRRPQPERLVAIGDVHGDIAATRSALKAAGAIDDADNWIGGKLVVVQTGDVLDRGDDEQAILDLFFGLIDKAKAAGGEFIFLNGNHELMNAAGDFRYVTPGSRDAFGDRVAALKPGGEYAKKLARHDLIAIVGDTVFSHAGPFGEFVTHLEEVNLSSRCWLDGQGGSGYEPPIAMTSEDSPIWTRAYGMETVDCAAAKAAMDAMGVKRIVVGHTVQQNVNSQCDGAVWRIDVGLAKLYGGPIEVLEVYPAPRVITGTR